MRIKLFVFPIFILLTPTLSLADGPSFDCQKATNPQEKLICSDSNLAGFDKHVGTTYSQLLKELPSVEAKKLQKIKRTG